MAVVFVDLPEVVEVDEQQRALAVGGLEIEALTEGDRGQHAGEVVVIGVPARAGEQQAQLLGDAAAREQQRDDGQEKAACASERCWSSAIGRASELITTPLPIQCTRPPRASTRRTRRRATAV